MKTLIALGATLALTACGSLSPSLDAEFGHAVMLAQSQQTIDPNAAAKAGTPNGVDGQAAHSGYSRYQEGFRSPPPQPSLLSIGIAPAGGSGGK